MSCRVVSLVSAYVVPLILLLWCGMGEGGPLGFGLFSDFENGTSVLASLALAHLEHKLDKISAFADLLGVIANITGTAFIG